MSIPSIKMMHRLLVSVSVVTFLLLIRIVNSWVISYKSTYTQSYQLFRMITQPASGTSTSTSNFISNDNDNTITTSTSNYNCCQHATVTVDCENVVVVGNPNDLKQTVPVKSKTIADTDTDADNCDNCVIGVGAWMKQYNELVQFYKKYNHTIVPKRYKDNVALGNWVNKQRQQYRNYIYKLKPCSLTIQRINLLNTINFVWNATSLSSQKQFQSRTQQFQQQIVSKLVTSTSTSPTMLIHNEATELNVNDDTEEEWWNQYNQLKLLLQTIQVVSLNTSQLHHNTIIQYRPIHYVHRYNNTVAHWLDKLRDAYNNNNSSIYWNDATAAGVAIPVVLLTNDKIHALQQLDIYWYMSCREYIWEKRFLELQHYKTMYGDCCVPINYTNNIQLGQWVSNQRKLLKKYSITTSSTSTTKTKLSSSTYYRIERLNSIGFVWNRWEYEFTKKQIKL